MDNPWIILSPNPWVRVYMWITYGWMTMAETGGVLQALPPSSPPEILQNDASMACPVCGHGHSSDIDRFEHWLLEGGGLRRVTDLGWKGVPLTRPGIWIPGNPLPISTVSRTMRRGRGGPA